MNPDYWSKAKAHLSTTCPTLAMLIARYEGETLRAKDDGFYTLARAVVGQQISVKAADAIWGRLEKAVHPFTPQKLLRKRDSSLRACGLSEAKVKYLRNVAEFFKDRGVTGDGWHNQSDAEVIAALTTIKGIGTWTAEMFLIFHLLRPDVLPLKDLGLLKAIDLHYTGGKRLTGPEYEALAAGWAPYRSVATWYLWRALDPVPVEY